MTPGDSPRGARMFGILAWLLAVACGGNDSGGSSSGADLSGDSLVIAVGRDEFGLRLNRERLGRYPLNAGICEPLLRLTSDFGIEPWLARKWEYRGNNTYRFTIRSDPTFHGGGQLGAASVKYTLERGIKDKTQYSFLSDQSVRIIDDSTLDIRPMRPNLRVLEQMVHMTYAVVADSSDGATLPICTGPFQFREYVPRSHLSVERNDAYWGDKAKLQRLIFRFIPDDYTRALALKAGNVDVIFDVNRSMVANLEQTSGIKVVAAPPGAVILMYIATRGKAPYTRMSDPAVRRAVAMAIDRTALVREVMDGLAAEVSTVNPPSVLGRHASLVRGVPYDPARARRLLDSAGWTATGKQTRQRAGAPLVLSLIAQPGAVDRSVTQYVQAQLAEVGIEVRIEDLDAAAYESRLNSGTFDLDIEVPNQNDANPAFLLALRWYSKSNVRSAPIMAAGARFDSLVERSLVSVDRDEAQKAAAEAMHVLVDEEVAAIPLAGVSRIYAMSSKVRGFVPHPSRLYQSWSSVWLAR
ncbi:MAG: ABC transporter substrate-binding protein [Gemmatimonadaceae bacterium]|nr:ABC transporter substrate-binding protein [Gemmatimonadaceae bacterium]